MAWLTWILSNIVLATLLALAAWIVQRWLRRPAIARVLWVLALLKLLTPPLVSVPLFESPGGLACTLGVCNCGPHAVLQPFVREMLPWILLAAWTAGAGATSWNAWRRWLHFRRLLRHASPAPLEWQALASRLSTELSIARAPAVLTVPGRLPPMVTPGWRRPRLLLPIALIDQLNARQRTALLLHELVHIRRHDHLVRLLELTVGVAFWWLPIFGMIGRQLRACEEACCDEAVVARHPQLRGDYARLLLDVLDFADPLPRHSVAQATAMSVARDIEQRLRAILSGRRQERRTLAAGVFVMCLACAVLPCHLQVEVVGRRAPATVSADVCEPGTSETTVINVVLEGDTLAALCCPS
jgi:beta-lactamase regulating signal transducer with metallopeptidase domain